MIASAVGVVAALCLLVEVLGVGLSRVVLRLAVGFVGSLVGGFVDVGGVCGSGTCS